MPNEEAMLEQALALSMEDQDADESVSRQPDFSNMTEEEQIAFAVQMSMQDASKYCWDHESCRLQIYFFSKSVLVILTHLNTYTRGLALVRSVQWYCQHLFLESNRFLIRTRHDLLFQSIQGHLLPTTLKGGLALEGLKYLGSDATSC